mmetsp:Transcript_23316/g.55277  ORF Transcript_23316/g.55277 Transcript_23316/m.55277 type:complete len:442 (+) Transcript_23316:105-1430(+)
MPSPQTATNQASEESSCPPGAAASPPPAMAETNSITATSSATPEEATSSTTSRTTRTKTETTGGKVWALPYIVACVFFISFLLFWMYFAILQRYWIKNNWNDSLPGLDTTPWHKFSMRMHMTAGAIGMLLGPIQFAPYIRKRHRALHRWTGRLYCVCGMLACFFGEWFIVLKGRLVGGWNMTAAFAVAGLAIGYTSFMTWKTSRHAKFGTTTATATTSTTSNRDAVGRPHSFQNHRDWAIRSYAQMVAPALYRYWYIFMEIFGLYRTPIPLRNGGYCDEHDFCPDYSRLLDAAYCWIYWISAGIVAEIIIYYIPPIGKEVQQMYVAPYYINNTDQSQANETETITMTSPLLSSSSSNEESFNERNGGTNSAGQDPLSYGSSSSSTEGQRQQGGDAVVNDSDLTSHDLSSKPSPRVVNGIGILLALASAVVTIGMFYLVLKS